MSQHVRPRVSVCDQVCPCVPIKFGGSCEAVVVAGGCRLSRSL